MNRYKKVAISVLCALVFLPQVLPARPVAVNFSDRTRFNSAIRSVFLPGWGQAFNEQEGKGYIVGGVFLISAVATFVLSTRANKTYDDYEKTGVKDSSLYDDYLTQSGQAATASYIMGGMWLYAVVDAYIFGKSPSPAVDQFSKKEGLDVDLASGVPCLSYTKRF